MSLRNLTCIWLALAGCAARSPATHYYSLVVPGETNPSRGRATIAVLPFDVDPAYEDRRIAYRESAYRLDYYDYHLWSAPPAYEIAEFLRLALVRSGRFQAVTTEIGADTNVILRGRVISMEEVDVTPERWTGELVLDLRLEDRDGGDVLWQQLFELREDMPEQSPEGLAAALSAALAGAAEQTIPVLARIADRLYAQRAAEVPPTAERE